jgi:hypothetical protein
MYVYDTLSEVSRSALDRRLEMLGSENFRAVTKTHVRLVHFTWFVFYNFGELGYNMDLVKELLSPSLALQIIVLMSFFFTKFFQVWLFFPFLFSWKQCCGPGSSGGRFRRILVC